MSRCIPGDLVSHGDKCTHGGIPALGICPRSLCFQHIVLNIICVIATVSWMKMNEKITLTIFLPPGHYKLFQNRQLIASQVGVFWPDVCWIDPPTSLPCGLYQLVGGSKIGALLTSNQPPGGSLQLLPCRAESSRPPCRAFSGRCDTFRLLSFPHLFWSHAADH